MRANLLRMQHEGAHQDDLLSRADLARWSGLPERHPLVGLLHRFGAVRQVNAEFEALSPLSGDAFIDAAFAALRMSLEIAEDDLQRIPETGPFVVVSNHPFGVLDALALIRHIRRRRPDFKLGVDGMLGATAQLDDALIVVSEGDPHRSRPKVSGWKLATEHLRSGGGFGVFPAGRVSSFRRSKRVVADGRWSASVSGWAVKQGCPVVPV